MQTAWSIRRYRQGDIPALVALANAVSDAYGDDPLITEAEMERSYSQFGRDPLRQVVVVDGALQDGMPTGSLIGSGRAFPVENSEANECAYELSFRVHPSLRDSGLERVIAGELLKIVDAEEARKSAGGDVREGRRVVLRAFSYDTNAEGNALWQWLGLRENRRWYWLHRLSSEEIADPQPVPGVTMHTYRKPQDAEAVMKAALASFADHYGFNKDLFAEEWQYWDNVATLRPDLSWVAEEDGSDGNIVALSICDVGTVKNDQTGEPAALITYVGTVREWRGKRLARNLLLHNLHSLREAEVEDVYLNVDADSPTGATRLYDSVGFETKKITFQFECDLRDVRRQVNGDS
jgi:ribosomal protein S18 acetylase RimI-like enzyme